MADIDEPARILNPEAVGDPDQTPVVFAPWLVEIACHGNAPSRDGFCGGLNGFHAEDCPEASPR